MILEKIFRRLLVLYPSPFRAEFEEEMVEFFHDRMREAVRTRGRIAAFPVFLAAVADLLWSATVERIELRKRQRRKRVRPMLDTLSFHLKSAISTLSHRPGFASSVVSTLALGIAANTAVFSVVDAVLLRPLPYGEPERIVTLWNRYDRNLTSSSPPDYMDRKRESRLLDAIAAIRERSGNLAVEGGARRVQISRVTADFFRVMGVEPLTGPVVFPGESSGDAERVAVLSFGLWQNALGGGEVIGRSLRIDGESYLVMGVMPESFDYPPGTEIFLPLSFTPEELADNFRGNEYLSVIGRARTSVTLEELEREMNAIALSVLDRVPERREFLKRNGFGGSVVPLREQLVGESRAALKLLFGAVLVVLLASGGTVAHLTLSTASARSHELAVRSSLGATRRSLFSQLVTESVVLSLAGGAVGLGLAFFLVGVVPSVAGNALPRAFKISFDGRAVLFTLAVALAMGILSGLVPAWQASGGALRSATRSSSSRRARRTRSAFVVSEVALALVLMFTAGLLVRSLQRLSSREPGFEPQGRFSFALDFPQTLYPQYEERLNLARTLRESLRALPGVSSVSASARIPLDGRTWTGTFHPEGYQPAAGEPIPGAEFNVVTPDYLATLGIPLLRGREFEDTDTAETTAVVLVDEWTEGRFWPEGAIGRRINLRSPSRPPDLYEVVGVVGHVQYESLDEDGRFQLYFPVGQRPWWNELQFTLHARGNASALLPRARGEVARLSPDLAVHSLRALETVVSETLAFRGLQTALLGAFGLVALALSAVGIYSVLSHSVIERRREVGVRMALGASRGAVLRLVLREGILLFSLGISLGALATLGVSRLVARFLFGVEPIDAITYLSVIGVLSSVALAAALVPALRAARSDPFSAIGTE